MFGVETLDPANVTPPTPATDVCVVSPNWGPTATPYLESATQFWGTSPSDAQRLSVLLATLLAGGAQG